MTALLAVVLAGVTAALAVPRSPLARSLARLEAVPPATAPEGRRRRTAVVLVVLGGLAVVVIGIGLGGARGGVVALAGVIAVGTVAQVVRLHHLEGRARRDQAAVSRACEVLASFVRVGQVPADALALAAQDCPVLTEAATVQQVGGDVSSVLLDVAGRPGHGGLADLARAWRVSVTTGAPMAPALEEVAAGLASDESLRSVVSAELSAPRSTGKVMAVLPLLGIGLGYLLGGQPLRWLTAGPLGWTCLLLGLLLAAVGVLWIERLARAAAAEA